MDARHVPYPFGFFRRESFLRDQLIDSLFNAVEACDFRRRLPASPQSERDAGEEEQCGQEKATKPKVQRTKYFPDCGLSARESLEGCLLLLREVQQLPL